MKKIIKLLALTLLLSGCSNKIVCKTNNDNNNSVNIKYIIKYDDNGLTNIITEKTYSFNTKEERESFEPFINYTINISNADNIKTSYKKKNKKYILIQKYDVNSISEDILLKNGLKKDKDDLLKYLSDSGLTCK